MANVMSIILAAGEGKRMKSKNCKVLHALCGKSMIRHVYDAALTAGVKKQIIIVGYKNEQVKQHMGKEVLYVQQQEQFGTGHAMSQALEYIDSWKGHVLVLYGDAPLITGNTLTNIIRSHIEKENDVTLITAKPNKEFNNAEGYDRIMRGDTGSVIKIVNNDDIIDSTMEIKEINSGMYCFEKKVLVKALAMIDNKKPESGYDLKDVVEQIISMDCRVGTYEVENVEEIMEINDRIQLYNASKILYKNICRGHMLSGVTIIDPENTYIEEEVQIGMDTVIYPGTFLEGETVIGEDCIIGQDTKIFNSIIGNRVEITRAVIIDSAVDDDSKVGPFAYIRPESKIGKKVKIGDFVEIKKSIIGDRTKVPHITYIGDTEIGTNTNIGCGSITANYDGKNKHKTIIGNNVAVGSNVNLVAPVVIRDDSYIAAGSTITDEVPEYSLAIARSRQVIKENWIIQKGMKREEK
jgi:bifunctional UDP-N-acetylglucosamine pyrophosphorylase / glucosamine-1-phosphate N-acetyltransferase